MPQIKEVRVSVKRLIALKKYENVTYECEVTATVDTEGFESPQAVYNDCLAFCQRNIAAQIERIEKGEPADMGKPLVQDDQVPFK